MAKKTESSWGSGGGHRHRGGRSQGDRRGPQRAARRHLHAVPEDPRLPLERHRADVPDAAPDVRDPLQRAVAGGRPDRRAHPRARASRCAATLRARSRKLSSIPETDGVPEATDMVRELVKGHEAVRAHGALGLPPRGEGRRRVDRRPAHPAPADPREDRVDAAQPAGLTCGAARQPHPALRVGQPDGDPHAARQATRRHAPGRALAGRAPLGAFAVARRDHLEELIAAGTASGCLGDASLAAVRAPAALPAQGARGRPAALAAGPPEPRAGARGLREGRGRRRSQGRPAPQLQGRQSQAGDHLRAHRVPRAVRLSQGVRVGAAVRGARARPRC